MIFIRTLIPDPLFISFAAVLTYSIVCTMIVTPLVRRFALRMGFVDRPDQRRVHDGAIPTIGGIAFIITFLSAIFLAGLFSPVFSGVFGIRFYGLAVAALLILSAGLYDDARGMNFIQKFGVQILVGLILFHTGHRIAALPTIFWGTIDLGILSMPVTVLWVSALCNAINLIDGLDGLASGLVSISAFLIFLISIVQEDYASALMSLVLAGITLAFLYYNFFPAKIFMGDTGSLFLGLILSCIAIDKLQFTGSSNQLIPLVLLLGIPVFDMVLTVIRRAIKRRHLFRADRLHVHHRLVFLLGMSHKKAVLTLYGWSVFFGFVGCMTAFGSQQIVLIACLFILIILGYATSKLRYFTS